MGRGSFQLLLVPQETAHLWHVKAKALSLGEVRHSGRRCVWGGKVGRRRLRWLFSGCTKYSLEPCHVPCSGEKVGLPRIPCTHGLAL